MLLTDYLKKACYYEQDIYDRKLKIKKKEEEIEQVKRKHKIENENLQQQLEKENQSLQTLTEKYNKDAEESEFSLFPIFLLLIVMALTAGLFFLIRYIVCDVYNATTPSAASEPLFIINMVIVALIWLIWSFTHSYSVGSTIVHVIIFIASTYLSYLYLCFMDSNGKSIPEAILTLMVYVLIAEFTMGIVLFMIISSDQDKLRKTLPASKREIKKQKDIINNCGEKIRKHDEDTVALLDKMTKDLQNQRSSLTAVERQLATWYSKNLLHPNYQNWVAAATIYDYLDTGRCYELKGPDGAYNLFEQELRSNKIIGSLDGVIAAINDYGGKILKSQETLSRQLLFIATRR